MHHFDISGLPPPNDRMLPPLSFNDSKFRGHEITVFDLAPPISRLQCNVVRTALGKVFGPFSALKGSTEQNFDPVVAGAAVCTFVCKQYSCRTSAELATF